MQPIDLFILCYKRKEYTRQTLKYLFERTTYPMRVFLLIQENDKESNDVADEFEDKIFMRVNFSINGGVHMGWDVALSLAESEYFITMDNDIWLPAPQSPTPDMHLAKDWLETLVGFMNERPDYGAISLHPHIFIGATGIDPHDPEDVKERNMAGAVARIMRREAVWKAGGWEKKIEAGRNHEERVICSRLQTLGFKIGICSRLRAYHPFGKGVEDGGGGWGYPASFPPEMQKHNPQLKEEVLRFDNIDAYDNKTWLPK